MGGRWVFDSVGGCGRPVESTLVRDLTAVLQLGSLPQVVRGVVVTRFLGDITCTQPFSKRGGLRTKLQRTGHTPHLFLPFLVSYDLQTPEFFNFLFCVVERPNPPLTFRRPIRAVLMLLGPRRGGGCL